MNFFDLGAIHFFNQFSQHSWLFDRTLVFISGNNLFKSGVLITLIWWLWFKNDEQQSHARERIIATVCGCFAAMLSARILSLFLPFRLRPLHAPDINFILPLGMDNKILDGWSSFPSDHAVFFFTLATGLLFISRRVGLFAFIFTSLFIALPRIYLGLHYPTDIICGALIGILFGWAGNRDMVTNAISKPILHWTYAKPDLFYALFFFITYQMADMFDSSRAIIHACVELIINLSST
jgi:undecaprenyl-diphosphatase